MDLKFATQEERKAKQMRKYKKQLVVELNKIFGVSYDPLVIDKALGDPNKWEYSHISNPSDNKIKHSWAKPNGASTYLKSSAYKTAKANRVIVNPGNRVVASSESPSQVAKYIKMWLEFHKMSNSLGNDHSLPPIELEDVDRPKVKNLHPTITKPFTYGDTGVKKHVRGEKYFNVLLNPASDYGTRYMVDIEDPRWYSKLLKNSEIALKNKLLSEGRKDAANDLVLVDLLIYPKYVRANKRKEKLYKKDEFTLVPLFSNAVSPNDPPSISKKSKRHTNNIGSRLFSSYFRRNSVNDDGTITTHNSLGTGTTTIFTPPPPPPEPSVSFNMSQTPCCTKYTCLKQSKVLKSPGSMEGIKVCPYCDKHKMPKSTYNPDPTRGAKTYIHMCNEPLETYCPKPRGCDSMVKSSDISHEAHLCDHTHKVKKKHRPMNDTCLNDTVRTPPIYSPDKVCKLRRFFKLFRKRVSTELPQVLAALETSSDYVKFMRGQDTAWAEKSTMLGVLHKYSKNKKKSEKTESPSEYTDMKPQPPHQKSSSSNSHGEHGEEGEVVTTNTEGKTKLAGVADMSREQLLRSSSASFVFQIITGEIEYSKYELGADFEEFLSIFFPKDDFRIMMAVVEIIVPELADFVHNLLKDRTLMSAVIANKDGEGSIKRQLGTLEVLIKGKVEEHQNLLKAAFKQADMRRQEEALRTADDVMLTTGVVERMDGTTTVYNEVDSDEDDGGDVGMGKTTLSEAMEKAKRSDDDLGSSIMGSRTYSKDINDTLMKSDELPAFIDPTTKFAIENTTKLIGDYKGKVAELNTKLKNLKREEVVQYLVIIKNSEKEYLKYAEFQSTVYSLNKDPRVSKEEYLGMLNLMAISSRMTPDGSIMASSSSSSLDVEAEDNDSMMIGGPMGYLTPEDLLISHDAISADNMFEVAPNSCNINMFESNLFLHRDELADRNDVLRALSEHKNDIYDLENQLDEGEMTASLKTNTLKPYIEGAYSNEEFDNLLCGYFQYDKDLVTRDEASIISDESACKYANMAMKREDERVRKLKLMALKNQICNPNDQKPLNDDGGGCGSGTTTVTFTTNTTKPMHRLDTPPACPK